MSTHGQEIRLRLKADMRLTLGSVGIEAQDNGTWSVDEVEDLVEGLVSDAMAPIEHLLDEIRDHEDIAFDRSLRDE